MVLSQHATEEVMLNRPIFDGTEQPSDRAWAWQQYVDDRSRFAALGAEEVAAMEINQKMLKALEFLVAAVKEPALQSMGFDHPPEYATAEDAMLARAIFEAKEVIAEATMTDADRQKLQPGAIVLVRMDDGSAKEFQVKSAPWQLGHGAWLIGLLGISGGYALSRVIRRIERDI